MGARRARRQTQAGRVVLVDPALRDERAGHHGRLNLGYADLLGPERCWLAVHRSIGALNGIAPDRIVRAFAVSFYDSAERRRLGSVGRRLQALVYRDLPWVPRQARAALQFLLRRSGRSAAAPTVAISAPLEPLYLEELAGLIDGLGLCPDDHLVFTSLDAQMGRSILELVVQRRLADLPSLHLRLMYDDETTVDGGLGYAGLIERLAATGNLGGRLRLYCETRTHAAALKRRLGTSVGVAPYPAGCLPAPPPGAGRRLTISFLGEARVEKGIDWLPGVVSAFERRHSDLADRVEWLVHAGGQTIEAATIRDRLRAAAGRHGPPITYHFGSTSRQVYQQHLARTDVVLALQDPAVYARRGSGVAQEAIAAGRPLICRTGTSMAQEAGEATQVTTDPGSVADAVARIVREPDLWFARAAIDAHRFHDRLGQNDLVRDCAAPLAQEPDRSVAVIAVSAPLQLETALRLDAHSEALSALGYLVVRVHLVAEQMPVGVSLASALGGHARDRHSVASFEVRRMPAGGFGQMSRALRSLVDGTRVKLVLADDELAMRWIGATRLSTSSRRYYSRPALPWMGEAASDFGMSGWQEAPIGRPTRSRDAARLRQAWHLRLKERGSKPPTAGSRPAANRV